MGGALNVPGKLMAREQVQAMYDSWDTDKRAVYKGIFDEAKPHEMRDGEAATYATYHVIGATREVWSHPAVRAALMIFEGTISEMDASIETEQGALPNF